VPEVARHALALRLGAYGELGEVGAERCREKNGRAAPGLLPVDARDVALEEGVGALAREAGLEERAESIAIDARPAVVAQHGGAAPHERARALDREQLAEQVQGRRD